MVTLAPLGGNRHGWRGGAGKSIINGVFVDRIREQLRRIRRLFIVTAISVVATGILAQCRRFGKVVLVNRLTAVREANDHLYLSLTVL